MELNDRKKLILKTIVDAYIERGEPVGSKYLVDYSGIPLSPATIRSVMGELEQLGLLEQPHTSAGRVPSNMGYRVYVDTLMDSYRLTEDERSEIDHIADINATGVDSLVEQSAKVLSSLTSLMSVSMTPKISTSTVSRFEVLYLDANDFLLILITSMGIVKTKYIHSRNEVDNNILSNLCVVLNENLAGKTAENITLPLIMKMEAGMSAHASMVAPILKIVYEVVTEIDNARLYIDGIKNLLEYPEYHDIEKAREIFTLIEERERIIDAVSFSEANRLKVYIGDENTLTTKGDTSFVFKTFTLKNSISGAIGVFGPKRMNYPRVIAKLEYFLKNITDGESEQ